MSSSDDFLRAVANASDVDVPMPEEQPERIAHFRIVARIGRGGMGVVWRAHDEKLGREVALKVLPTSLQQDADRRKRLLREAKAAAALTHPNVATVYEAGEDEAGRVWIAIELVDGESLRARLGRGALPLGEAVRIFSDVVRGIARAHASGVVHRDIKPDNVMLGRDVGVKVLDFGLATRSTLTAAGEGTAASTVTATVEGRIAGTPAYMSPEQVAGKTVDARSDVFSLGILFYEMVTGERPFAGDSHHELAVAIARDTPRSPSSIDARLPAVVDRIVARCLEKDPAARFADARDLLDEIERLAPEMKLRTARRSRSLLLGAVVALVAVTVGAFALAKRGGGESSPIHSVGGGSTLPAAASGSPLASSRTVLACPPLRASGVETPTGWLGGIAATIACKRAVYLLGGKLDRTLVPAELLSLPRTPVEGFPADPYSEPDARDRAISAARERAAAWLDGEIVAEADGFRVELRVVAGADRELGRARGTGAEIYQAVREAMSGLVATGALPHAERLEGDALWITGIEDADLGLALEDWWFSNLTGAIRGERDRLAPKAAQLGSSWWVVETTTSRLLYQVDDRELQPPPVERASHEALARSAMLRARPDDPELAPLEDELRRAAADESC